MTQKYPKRLIEVDLPIKRISAHARREKSIRHGHISTLHIWWARRPLAACRAVICASLWPDPADPLCPQDFRDKAAKIIFDFARAAANNKDLGESCDHETWIKWQALAKTDRLDSRNEAHLNILRFALLDFIADFANWDNSTVKDYLDASRALTQAAHEALGGEPGTRPLVVDPFAGGGSIPLEALRVGADVFASDLNPIPVLLNKVVLEYVPKYGKRLADEVRKWGLWIKKEAEKELAQLYPEDPDGSTPIAYLWARTIQCEGPGCGAVVPLVRSLWLAKKPNRSVAVQLVPRPKNKRLDYQIIIKDRGRWTSQENPEKEVLNPKFEGTIKQGSVTCPCCGYTTPVARVRQQLKARKGGGGDASLMSVVIGRKDEVGRQYRTALAQDQAAIDQAICLLNEQVASRAGVLPYLPTEQFSGLEPRRIPLPQYGICSFADLFSPRPLLALLTFSDLVRESNSRIREELGTDLANAVTTLLALVVDRQADKLSSLARWDNSRENPQGTFARQALPMVWDFSEISPFSGSGGDWETALGWVVGVLERESNAGLSHGRVENCSATNQTLPDDSADAIVTDPPYYYSVPYSDLSDFFYVWLKRSLLQVHPELFSSVVTKKEEECVQNLPHSEVAHLQKSRTFYRNAMGRALTDSRRVAKPSAIAIIVFAHSETAAWEALLGALISAGWCVTASWPIDTEMANRVLASRQSTLASSVHLVCRPRGHSIEVSGGTDIGNWRDVLQELPQRIHEWMPRLAREGVVGADAIFACLGPALEVFSRYSRVEKASGEAVELGEYLEYVWAAVSKEALTLVFEGADASGFEADARLTAMWLWTLKAPDSNGKAEHGGDDEDSDEQESKKPQMTGFKLEFDAARKIAQGLGAHLESLTHLVEISGDQARLLPVAERTKHLFGKDEEEPTRVGGKKKSSAQLNMFAELTEAEDAEVAWKEKTVKRVGETALDRVHQAMILFAAGRGEALKRFVVEDGVGQDGKFWRLAQALSALYPTGTDEKRWVDGVLARKKQFGF